jgi:uncharacterized protein YciI
LLSLGRAHLGRNKEDDMRTKLLAVAAALLLAPTILAHAKGGRTMTETNHTPARATYTITYAGGPQWKPGLGPEQQDIGAHLAWVKTLFGDKRLLANGHLANGRGFYVFDVRTMTDIDKLVTSDPGIDSGVLQVEAAAPWTLVFDNLGADVHGQELFVVNERPGRNWRAGKTLLEQDLQKHLAYVQAAFAAGTLLAGGPVDGHQGRYVVAGANQAAVERWVQADPAVLADILHPEILGWQVFNRQR